MLPEASSTFHPSRNRWISMEPSRVGPVDQHQELDERSVSSISLQIIREWPTMDRNGLVWRSWAEAFLAGVVVLRVEGR
jgi:hypothetical protein